MQGAMVNQHIDRVIGMLQSVCPSVASDIEESLECSVADYAQRYYRFPARNPGVRARAYRDRLITRLVARAHALGSSVGAEELRLSLERFPVIQTSPHCQLYIDTMVFWAYFMGWMGARQSGCRTIPVFNTATITLQSKPAAGPAWLSTSKQSFNITNVANHKLSGISVCAAPRDVYFDPAKLREVRGLVDDEKLGVEKLLQCLNRCGEDLAERTDLTNLGFLTSRSSEDIFPILFSEPLVVDLMTELLEENDSLVSGLLFDPERSTRLRAAFARAHSQPYTHFLSHMTNHFWGVRNNRIRKLDLLDGWLIEVDEPAGAGFRIPYERASLIEGLRSGRLIPNLFWSFLLVVLLPHFGAIGGTRQIGYLEGFIDILCQALDPCVPEEAELMVSLRATRLSFWGAKLIECMPGPLRVLSQLPQGAEFDALHEQFRQMTLRQATKELSVFYQHPRWKHLY